VIKLFDRCKLEGVKLPKKKEYPEGGINMDIKEAVEIIKKCMKNTGEYARRGDYFQALQTLIDNIGKRR